MDLDLWWNPLAAEVAEAGWVVEPLGEGPEAGRGVADQAVVAGEWMRGRATGGIR